MKVNIAVYTATEGFDWQPGSAYRKAELEKYHAMIGKFPDILMDVVPYGGVFVCDGRVVFYRYLVFEKGDSRGRDALYCVLGTLSFDEMRKADLAHILGSRQFSRPHKPFPTELDVEECAACRTEPKSIEELEQGLHSLRSASDIGYYATFFPDGKFFCRMNGDRDHPQLDLDYSNSCLKPKVLSARDPASDLTSSRHAPKAGSVRPPVRNYGDINSASAPLPPPPASQNAIVLVLAVLLGVALAALAVVLFLTLRSSPVPQSESQPAPPMSAPSEQSGQGNESRRPNRAGDHDFPFKTNVATVVTGQHPPRRPMREETNETTVDAGCLRQQVEQMFPPFLVITNVCPQCCGAGQSAEWRETTRQNRKFVVCMKCRGQKIEKGLVSCPKCNGTGGMSGPITGVVQKVKCSTCQNGKVEGLVQCSLCRGRGECETSVDERIRKGQLTICSNCSGSGMVQTRLVRCPVCQGTKEVRACPECFKQGHHHERKNGRFVLCDAQGRMVNSAPCKTCGGDRVFDYCEYCDNQGYVNDTRPRQSAAVEKAANERKSADASVDGVNVKRRCGE